MHLYCRQEMLRCLIARPDPTLPLTHSSVLNVTLSRLNPYHVKRDAFTAQTFNPIALDSAIRDLCKMPEALMLRTLPPGCPF